MSLEAGGKVRAVSDTKSKGTREWRGEKNEDSRNEGGKYPGCSSCNIQLQGGLLKLE